MLNLGKKKVKVIYCGDAEKWETNTGSGFYFEAFAQVLELQKKPTDMTSDVKLQEGEQELVVLVVNGKEKLKLKLRQPEKEEKKK